MPGLGGAGPRRPHGAGPGGPTLEKAKLCVAMIAETGRLASLDVMELNPTLDDHQVTASISVGLIPILLGGTPPV